MGGYGGIHSPYSIKYFGLRTYLVRTNFTKKVVHSSQLDLHPITKWSYYLSQKFTFRSVSHVCSKVVEKAWYRLRSNCSIILQTEPASVLSISLIKVIYMHQVQQIETMIILIRCESFLFHGQGYFLMKEMKMLYPITVVFCFSSFLSLPHLQKHYIFGMYKPFYLQSQINTTYKIND